MSSRAKKGLLHRIYFEPETRAFTVANDIYVVATIISILGIILETVQSLEQYSTVFITVEYIAVTIFTFEYVTRIIASKKKLSYVFSFFGIIDLLAIIPTYIGLTNLTFLKAGRALRILRFLRILRLAKIARITSDKRVSKREYRELYLLNVKIYFATLFALTVILGSAMYIVEGHSPGYSNIPEGMLWALQVLISMGATTEPQTTTGVGLLIFTQFCGLLLLGMVLDIVGKTINRFIFGTEKFYFNKADE